jgi:hypothetical protein
MPIAPNTVALYNFENNALDSSGNNYSLTNTGGVNFNTTPAPIPQGLYDAGGNFSPTTRFQMPSSGTPAPGTFYFDFAGLSAYTVEFYVYMNSLATMDVFQIYDDNSFQYGLFVRLNSDGSITYYSNGSANGLVSPGGVIAAGAWYHVAITTDAVNKKIFVNNVLRATGPQSGGTPLVVSRQLFIGQVFVPLNGFLDQFRFSNVARTSFPTIDPPASAFDERRRR